MKITLKGDKELQRLLKKAQKKYPDTVSKLIKNNAEKGRNLSQTYAPRDTGFLIESHSTRFPSKLDGEIISGAGYSGYVNYGTRYQGANPFFTKMWDVTKEELKKDFKDTLRGLYE